MELIDNLDTLKVGDYLKVDSSQEGTIFQRRKLFVGIVTKSNKEQLFIEMQFEFDLIHATTISYHNKGELVVIPKIPRRTKKKKLKHKTQSHNHGTIMHRLSKNEVRKIKTDELLKELEEKD